MKEAQLSSEQTRILETARVAFMVAAPFYADLYFRLGKEMITREEKTLATDGRRIFINPEYFCGLKPSEQVFTLAHEMDHLVCRHPQRFKSYHQAGEIRGKPADKTFANICMDYVINANLVASGVGSINPDWLYDKTITGDMLWEDVYEKHWQDPPPPPPGGGTGRGEGQPDPSTTGVTKTWKDNPGALKNAKGDAHAKANQGAFDELMEPAPADDLPEEHEFLEAVAHAAAVAKAMGKMPGHLQRMVDELLTPQVDWKDQIRLLMTGRIGSRGETWAKPNRRRLVLNPLVIMPGKRGYGCELVVVGVDTSGSIGARELDAFFGEVGGILADVKPRRILVIGCDYNVSQVDEVMSLDEFDGLREKGIKGGGGTRFSPVFEYIEENNLRPETCVYLTDGYGDFTFDEPRYPTVWAITNEDQTPPWGDVVRIAL
jgi:predicted metal-dependent peptidase